MAKNKKEESGIVNYPDKIMFITGTTAKVTEEYNKLMCNFTDTIVDTMMSGTPDNLVLAIIYHKPYPRTYY